MLPCKTQTIQCIEQRSPGERIAGVSRRGAALWRRNRMAKRPEPAHVLELLDERVQGYRTVAYKEIIKITLKLGEHRGTAVYRNCVLYINIPFCVVYIVYICAIKYPTSNYYFRVC